MVEFEFNVFEFAFCIILRKSIKNKFRKNFIIFSLDKFKKNLIYIQI